MSSNPSVPDDVTAPEQTSAPAEHVSPTTATATEPSPEARVSAEPESSGPESASEQNRPRVRLNPTVDITHDKAVPFAGSFAAPVAKPAAERDANADEVDEGGEPVAKSKTHEAPVPRPAQAVAIPPKVSDLDAEMEAEIAEALASGEIPGAIADPAAVANPSTAAAAPALAGTRQLSEDELETGARVKGTVQAISGENVIVDLGYRASGYLPMKQFKGKPPAVGASLDFIVDKYVPAEGVITLSLPKATRSVGNWSEVAVGQVVDCMVTKSNKGGLEVNISNLRGFLPAGQVDVGYVSNLDSYIGQKLRVKVMEVNPQKRNLIVSRRAFLEIERAETREEMWKKIEVGQTYTGTVKTIKDYGAFVDIGGIDGLLHVGEISWSRVNHPSDLLKEGDQVEVQVVACDHEKSKISLGMRQLQKNPWNDMQQRFPVNSVVHGKVTKTTEFGAFVELEAGLEGLIHISELDHRRVHRVTDVVKVGQEVEAQILSVDLERKRIALSLKSLRAKPDAPVKQSDEDMAPGGGTPYERKRKGPLRGGREGDGGGLLFG